MSSAAEIAPRCSVETVEFARIEELLQDRIGGDLKRLFSAPELDTEMGGADRIANFAECLATKQACLKLFPKEAGSGQIQHLDFTLCREHTTLSGFIFSPQAQKALARHRIARLHLSVSRSGKAATATVRADPVQTDVPWFGRLLYHLLPYRRAVVLGNLHRVFGDVLPQTEIVRIAQAYYAHYVRFLFEFVRQPFMSAAQRNAWVKIENIESPLKAYHQGNGVLLLTGHFGNFEVATVAGISRFPEYRGRFHFIRRPLKPAWLNSLVTWRFRKAGLGTLPKRGSLEAILDVLSQGRGVVFIFDQHAGGREGIPVEFFGQPAGTFKSLAILALETGAPVIPASSWREPDGSHVIRFDDPLPLIECDDVGEAIRRNTRAYNEVLERMLLRHPEQWIWMHRRWKLRA
jgi:KDO2-lipid IV(A) lauroyltransferase